MCSTDNVCVNVNNQIFFCFFLNSVLIFLKHTSKFNFSVVNKCKRRKCERASRSPFQHSMCKHVSATSAPAKSKSLHVFLVSTPTDGLQAARPARLPETKGVTVEGQLSWQRGGRGDSYPGFLGSLSRDELPPFSLRTSFSLLRRIDARSLLKEPLLFREPEPSWWETSEDYGCRNAHHRDACLWISADQRPLSLNTVPHGPTRSQAFWFLIKMRALEMWRELLRPQVKKHVLDV